MSTELLLRIKTFLKEEKYILVDRVMMRGRGASVTSEENLCRQI
jgi:hypothetical protein